jgi:hypothetical protein
MRDSELFRPEDPGNFGRFSGEIAHCPSFPRLNEAQQTFRNLLAKVDSLRASIDSEEERLDAALSFYAAEVAPRLGRQAVLRKDLVRALAPYLNETLFPRKQERLEMKELIQELLDEIAKTEKGLTDIDLREVYGVVHGVSYAEHERKTLAAVKENLERMYAEAGLAADFSELDSAANEADFMAKAEELTARVRKLKEAETDAARCHDHSKHSTGDEQLRAAEEFQKQSVAKIYKQLARVLHPDLERDSERQKQKVELMQELTVAFRQNDLHTLLRLEMQWIENEGGDIEHLTNEKLAVYNQVLAGQVEGLERRLQDMALHQRYRPIVFFDCGRLVVSDGPEKVRELDGDIGAIERSLTLVWEARTATEVRAAVRPFRSADRYPHNGWN